MTSGRTACGPLALFMALGVWSAPAHADVCELNSKAVTDRAMRHLAVGGVIQDHRRCDTCATTTTTKVVISSVERKPSGQDFEILVVGTTVERTQYRKTIDLADTYVLAKKGDKKYANLGFLAKCEDVTEENAYRSLPDHLVEK